MTLCAGKQESDRMLKKFQRVPLSAARATHELWHQETESTKKFREKMKQSRKLKKKKPLQMFSHLKPG